MDAHLGAESSAGQCGGEACIAVIGGKRLSRHTAVMRMVTLIACAR